MAERRHISEGESYFDMNSFFFHMIMSLMCVAFTLYNAVVRIYMFANHYLDVGCEIRIV